MCVWTCEPTLLLAAKASRKARCTSCQPAMEGRVPARVEKAVMAWKLAARYEVLTADRRTPPQRVGGEVGGGPSDEAERRNHATPAMMAMMTSTLTMAPMMLVLEAKKPLGSSSSSSSTSGGGGASRGGRVGAVVAARRLPEVRLEGAVGVARESSSSSAVCSFFLYLRDMAGGG